MKRHFVFIYHGEKIEVDAQREGDEVIIDREGQQYRVTIDEKKGETERESGPRAASTGSGEENGTETSGGTATGRATGSAPAGSTGPSDGEPSSSTSTQAGSASSGAGGSGEVPAPMTGLIKEVLVAEGDTVTEGEKLMIMEAMKMDIEVSAISGGTVQKLHVKINDSVQEGQPLVLIG